MLQNLACQIGAAVRARKLREPFTAEMAQKVCPGWAMATYNSILSKHAEGNPGHNPVFFVRTSPGHYRLKDRELPLS